MSLKTKNLEDLKKIQKIKKKSDLNLLIMNWYLKNVKSKIDELNCELLKRKILQKLLKFQKIN